MRFVKLAVIMLCLAHFPSRAAPGPSSKVEKSRLDTLSPIFVQMGFAIKKKPKADSVSPWEKKNFGLLRKRTMALKSRFSSDLGKDSFYRFWIDEEYFGSEVDARHRLDSLYQMPSNFKGEREKVFPLRRGYIQGAKVFIFRTDVSAYSGKLEQLTNGFELLEGISGNDERKKILDSLKTEIRKPN
jgi:hypothetical protein